MIHDLLEVISTSSLLTWITINIVAPLDRKLLLASNGRFCLTGSSTILLKTIGAKSGAVRYTSLPGLYNGDDIVLLASKGGAKSHPAWYHNMVKNPSVEVITGGKRQIFIAEDAQGERREEMWQWLTEQWSGFTAYQTKAAPRILPIIVLSPK